MPPRPLPPGHTLIELILVVLLLGIVAGLAAPPLQRALDRLRVSASLGQLARDLYLARMLAVREGRSVEVRLAADPQRCVTGYRIQTRADTTAVLTRAVSAEHRWLCLRHNGAPRLVYDARGLLRSGGKSFWIAHPGGTDSLVVSWVGRVRRTD